MPSKDLPTPEWLENLDEENTEAAIEGSAQWQEDRNWNRYEFLPVDPKTLLSVGEYESTSPSALTLPNEVQRQCIDEWNLHNSLKEEAVLVNPTKAILVSAPKANIIIKKCNPLGKKFVMVDQKKIRPFLVPNEKWSLRNSGEKNVALVGPKKVIPDQEPNANEIDQPWDISSYLQNEVVLADAKEVMPGQAPNTNVIDNVEPSFSSSSTFSWY